MYLKCLAAACASFVLMPAQAAVTYVGSIDISTQLVPTYGIIPAHIAIDNSGATPVLYVTTLNDSGVTTTSIPALKISDPLGTPAISVFDTNDGNAGGGVAATRGYGGVATIGSDVYVAWTGNGSDDSARIRRYNSAGTQTGEWLWATLNQRLGGIDAAIGSANSNPRIVGARFFNTSTTNLTFFEATNSSTFTSASPVHDATGTAASPRDVAYDSNSGTMYVNASGILKKLSLDSGGDISTPSSYAAATSTYTELANNGVNSFAGHGVAVSANGQVIGFSPNQNAGVGANTMRLVDPSGNLLETIGTLDTPGNGTTGNLRRGIDMALAKIGGTNYVFVTDYDNQTLASRTYNRVAIYSTTTPLPVALTGFELE